ncbi:MAG: hypothetical protein WA173_20795 [Pseudomonas sp.]|uniref:hypothetical protein n=1 Tax=Pseudomonas sp. TaxID=306 RepID=UPI003BB7514E
MHALKTLLLPLLLIGSLIGFDHLEAATGPARHNACGWGEPRQSAPVCSRPRDQVRPLHDRAARTAE